MEYALFPGSAYLEGFDTKQSERGLRPMNLLHFVFFFQGLQLQSTLVVGVQKGQVPCLTFVTELEVDVRSLGQGFKNSTTLDDAQYRWRSMTSQ